MDRSKEVQELKDILESGEKMSDRMRESIQNLIILTEERA